MSTVLFMAGPLSAFARRKAVGNGPREYSTPIEAPIVVTAQVNDEVEPSAPPKKRRKKGDSSKSVVSTPPPPEGRFVDQDGSWGERGLDVQGSGSSDVEGELETAISNSEEEALSTVTERRLSTLPSKRSTIMSDTDSEWRIRLHQQDKLAIVGQYDLWVRSGAVSVLGAVVHASSKLHRVYAPSTHSIPSIKSVPNPYGTGNPPCEISILSCGSRIRMLKQVAPKFARIWNGKEQASSTLRSFVNVRSSVDDGYKRPLRLLEPPSDWWIMVSRLVAKNHAAVMVCGPKGAGKSTFCRMLANALLPNVPVQQRKSRSTQPSDGVAFLDLDPGQPEYSPPGEISLHTIRSYNFGPPFAHPTCNGNNELVRAHHLGHLSPKEDPHHYFRCAVELFSHYKKMTADRPSLPLIVNCSGWIQGSGLELLDNFIRDLDLTDVVYMSATGPKEVVDMLSKATTTANIQLHQLTSHASDVATRTAADMRIMQTISYFHLDEPEGDNLRWNPSPMAGQPPMVAHYAGPSQGIFATMVLGYNQSSEFLESILDGSIVGVVVIEEDLALELGGTTTSHSIDVHEADTDFDHGVSVGNAVSVNWGFTQSIATSQYERETESPTLLRTRADIPYLASRHHTTQLLRPERSHCLGQALVRGIDPNNKTIQLLTPIPNSTIRNVLDQDRQRIVLVRGKLGTPTWAYAEQFEFEKARRRRLGEILDSKGGWGPDDVRAWAERQPWASAVDGGRTGSGKVRRIRRDIRYKGRNDDLVIE